MQQFVDFAGPQSKTLESPAALHAPDVLLTPQQKRMILLHEIDPSSVAYNTGACFRLRGPLDLNRLKNAARVVVERHAVLRTCFALRDGAPVGWLRSDAAFEWEVLEFRASSQSPDPEAAISALRSRLERRIDLGAGALRLVIARLSDNEALLAIVMHHIVCDGWSFAVFVQELCTAYEQRSSDTGPAVAIRPVQYDAYAQWSNAQRSRRSYATDVGHFARALEGAPPCLELPWDRPRPALQTYHGAMFARDLPRDLEARLQQLAERYQVTPFVVLLATYYLVLRRYSGQRSIVVGVPVANREKPEFARAIGFFVNTLPLRAELDDEASFADLMLAVQGSLLDALDHQSAQIEDVVDALKLPRDASYPPLYQAMFAYQNAPAPVLTLRELEAEQVPIGTVGAKCDLTLNVDKLGGGLLASWEFNTDLFDHDSIVRLAECFEAALERVLPAPELRLRDIDIVPADQRQLLVHDWNSSRCNVPELTSFELIAAQAAHTPEAIAVRARSVAWTYRELLAEADRLAVVLLNAGVTVGSTVGVLAERSPRLIAGLLAIWRVGAAYVPLDPTYPADRLSFMLEDSGASVVLVGQVEVEVHIPEHVRRINLHALAEPEQAMSAAAAAKPTDLAYIIYTSGSTGRPKGVAIEHRSVVAFIEWARRQYTPEQLSRVLASTSICFDLSVFEFFVPLATGGSVELVRDALELAELAELPPVTLVNLVHSALAELIRRGAVPNTVQVVNFGGELPSNETAQKAYALGHVRDVYNVYGPTEDTVYSMCYRIEQGATRVPLIGRSIPNSQAYVLDEYRRLVPIGVTGELYLAGAGLARCYHGRTDLTDERFVQIDVDGTRRAYRTGDLARRQADGEVVFLGRRDHQVKVRGYRIELGEIDQALLRSEHVRQAVTVTWTDRTGELVLVSYFSGHNADVPVDRLRDQVSEWLPAYMVPSHFVQLPSLPYTPNGKLARDRLPPPPEARGSGSGTRAGTHEPLVAELYQELLGANGVGAEDDFFALGGHSLMAARAAARLAKQLGCEVTIRDLFRFPRVADLAAELALRAERGLVSSTPEARNNVVHRIVAGEFPGYHVNCFYHCVIQALNYFRGQSIHQLNDAALAFLGYRCVFQRLDAESVLAPTLFREISCVPHRTTELALDQVLGMRTLRTTLADAPRSLRHALSEGAFPILVGGTETVVDPSLAVVEVNEAAAELLALGNDFGVDFKTVPFGSRRLANGEDLLLIFAPNRELDREAIVTLWYEHVALRKLGMDNERRAFSEWLGKYEGRTELPSSNVLAVELEGVNVTLGSELGGFLRFERYFLSRLPDALLSPALVRYAELLDRTLADYQHQANVLRRAFLVHEDTPAAVLNRKLVSAVRAAAERQQALGSALVDLPDHAG